MAACSASIHPQSGDRASSGIIGAGHAWAWPRPKAASPAWSRLVLAWIQSGVSAAAAADLPHLPPQRSSARSRNHGPRTAVRLERVLFCKDWINLQLIGNLATDFSDASIPLLDLEAPACANEGFDQLDVAELKGQARAGLGAPPTYRFASAGRRRRARLSRRNSGRDWLRSILARCDGQHRHPTRVVRRRAGRHDDLPPHDR